MLTYAVARHAMAASSSLITLTPAVAATVARRAFHVPRQGDSTGDRVSSEQDASIHSPILGNDGLGRAGCFGMYIATASSGGSMSSSSSTSTSITSSSYATDSGAMPAPGAVFTTSSSSSNGAATDLSREVLVYIKASSSYANNIYCRSRLII